MQEFSPLLRPDQGEEAHLIHLVDSKGHEGWLTALPGPQREAVRAQKFTGAAGQVAIVPQDGAGANGAGGGWAVAVGLDDAARLDSWSLAAAAAQLPAGTYRLAGAEAGPAMLGWLLAQYRFDRYRKAEDEPVGPRILLTPSVAAIADMVQQAEAVALVRDMVNTPAADMGPEQLEAAVTALAARHDAAVEVTRGDALERGYPMVHAVGRAAARDYAPRLIELRWGQPDHPKIALVGKGVCFDSGGLDIKTGSSMRLMKKDMGGAAHALALAGMVMAARLPVRLHLIIPAVENAVSGNAFRPGDILASRKGLSVEIDNTDAEGRLILADALTRAAEEGAELILNYATLTGAARVALGPELPALFANDDALADDLLAGGRACDDPLWRLPLHGGYDKMLKSNVADTLNSAASGFAGAITAALFLRKFVPEECAWAHMDTYAWQGSAAPGRPEGGEALGLRAAWACLKGRYSAA